MKQKYRKLGEYKFSDLIEEVSEKNTDLKYGLNDIIGVTIEKELIPTIANLTQTALDKFYLVKKNTFVYNPRTHGVRLGMGFNEMERTYITSWNNVAFRVKETAKDIVLPKFLWIYFNRSEWDRQSNFLAWGSSTIVFAWNDFLNIKIKLPSVAEQQRIVNAYNTVDRRIRILKQMNENLVKLGITLVDKNVSKAILLNLSEQEGINIKKTLQDNWVLINISEFCEKMESGSTPSRSEADYWINGNIPWVKSGEVHNNITLSTEEYITEKALKETSTKLLPKDTVLMAMYGVTAGEVGYLNIEATTNQAICGMICKSNDDAAYLYFSLLQNQKKISSMSNGGAQNNLSKIFIENLKIIVPAKEVLAKMNLSLLVKQLKRNYNELVKLQELKQLIISRISGV